MSAARPTDRASPEQHRKNIVKLIQGLSHRHSQWQVFSDFVEMAAISISNAVDRPQYDKREARYMEIVKRYKPEEVQEFPKMFAELTLAMDAGPDDVMGHVFHDLELHNKYTGQFFTPYTVCQAMARMTLADEGCLKQKLDERGFVTACEPACGAGAMVIALADEMRQAGFNYQNYLHVTAVDIDPKCVHMAYVQFALMHIPAIVIHGNSLSLEEHSHWFTPAHIMGGWDWKLKHESRAASPEDAPTPASPTLPPFEIPTQTHVERIQQERSKPSQLNLF